VDARCVLHPLIHTPLQGDSAVFANHELCHADDATHHHRYNVADVVKIPANIPPGDYILGFRYDCEATAQVWSNCADVVIE
jgi:hypothetical protein